MVGFNCTPLASNQISNHIGEKSAMLEILATQKNYCAILHILLNFVKNIGTSWFAVVSALRFPGQARAIMPVPPPAGGRIIRHCDVTVTVAAQAAATDSEPGAASPGQSLPPGGTAPAGPGAVATAGPRRTTGTGAGLPPPRPSACRATTMISRLRVVTVVWNDSVRAWESRAGTRKSPGQSEPGPSPGWRARRP